GLIRIGTSDLFEDYRVTGGFRIPTNFGGTEYFITFEDLKKRLDKKYTFYRKTDSRTYDFSTIPPHWPSPVYAKSKTNYAEVNFRYPLDFTKSLRGILSYRMDQLVFQSSDIFSLLLTNYTEHWAAFRGEYVF